MFSSPRSLLPYLGTAILVVAAACQNDDPGATSDASVGGSVGSSVGSSAGTSDTATGTNPTGGEGAEEGESGTGAACGDGTCDVWEGCADCPEDCGACAMCDQAPACAGNLQPPTITEPMPELMTEMSLLTTQDILRRVSARIEGADASVRLLAHALASPLLDEPNLVTRLRSRLSAHPALEMRIRGALHRAGMYSVEQYRDQHPLDVDDRTLGQPTPPTAVCDNPRLRIRVASLTVNEDYDDVADDVVYCVITTEAETASELHLLPPTNELDEGDTQNYGTTAGIIWGADNKLAPPGGNMHINYDCFESDQADGFNQLAEAAAELVGGVGGIPIPGLEGGWTVPGSAVASLIMSLLALDTDDYLLNAQQIIDKELLLELTQGRYWNLRRSDSGTFWAWDWTLRLEAWGCTDDGTL